MHHDLEKTLQTIEDLASQTNLFDDCLTGFIERQTKSFWLKKEIQRFSVSRLMSFSSVRIRVYQARFIQALPSHRLKTNQRKQPHLWCQIKFIIRHLKNNRHYNQLSNWMNIHLHNSVCKIEIVNPNRTGKHFLFYRKGLSGTYWKR